jgi:hypothetical protein
MENAYILVKIIGFIKVDLKEVGLEFMEWIRLV